MPKFLWPQPYGVGAYCTDQANPLCPYQKKLACVFKEWMLAILPYNPYEILISGMEARSGTRSIKNNFLHTENSESIRTDSASWYTRNALCIATKLKQISEWQVHLEFAIDLPDAYDAFRPKRQKNAINCVWKIKEKKPNMKMPHDDKFDNK